MKQLMRWLYPGLRIKRWMFLFSVGIISIIIGAMMTVNYQVFEYLEEWIFRFMYTVTGSYNYTIMAPAGIFLVCAGFVVMAFSVRKLVKRFFELTAGKTDGPRGRDSTLSVPPCNRAAF